MANEFLCQKMKSSINISKIFLRDQEYQAFVAQFSRPGKPRNPRIKLTWPTMPGFCGQVAKKAPLSWAFHSKPGFSKPYYFSKPGQKPGKPGQARLCWAYQAFGRASDARVVHSFNSNN